MTGQQSPSGPPPGWYQDPWAAGMVRWWSGRDWTPYSQPAVGKPTDGFAVASLVSSISGLGPVGVVLGFIGRRRIKKDPDRRSGTGLATAGIVTGFVMTALIPVAIALIASGVFSQTNADDYSGTKQEIARTVDRFEDAWEDGDGDRVCSETFTPGLVDWYQGRCSAEWGEEGYVEIDIESITVTGSSATATGSDADVDWTFNFTYVDGEWLICSLESD